MKKLFGLLFLLCTLLTSCGTVVDTVPYESASVSTYYVGSYHPYPSYYYGTRRYFRPVPPPPPPKPVVTPRPPVKPQPNVTGRRPVGPQKPTNNPPRNNPGNGRRK